MEIILNGIELSLNSGNLKHEDPPPLPVDESWTFLCGYEIIKVSFFFIKCDLFNKKYVLKIVELRTCC